MATQEPIVFDVVICLVSVTIYTDNVFNLGRLGEAMKVYPKS